MSAGLNDFINELLNPPAEYTPIPFWFINDELSEREIKRQIEEFHKKGVDGFVLHPRIGIPKSIEYLSDEFMHYVKVAVETAAQYGMYVVLYDEGMYPSGSAHGIIAKTNPDFRSRGICIRDNPKEGRVLCRTTDGKYLLECFSGGTIRGIHFGEDDGEPEAPLAADILNPEAVKMFINLTHERYYSVVGEYFGKTIIGFFTDEPSILGRCPDRSILPWTKDFDEIIKQHGGKTEELEALFKEEENATTELYHRLILERECNVYYKALHDWCISHKVALMGHPHQSDDIELEEYFDIPGQDLVFRWVSPETGGTVGMDSVQAKCSADAARYLGKRRNSNECFGACNRDRIPWYFTGSDFKWFIDYLAVRGVNMFIPHAFYYSIKGKRSEERPPDVGMNSIWWEHYAEFSAYMKRLSYLMTDVVNNAEVMVLCSNRDMPVDEVRGFYENQIEFNYVPYSALSKAEITENGIKIGKNIYKYVLGNHKMVNLPDCVTEISSCDSVEKHNVYAENCNKLRVSGFLKNDFNCVFLVNEGDDEIHKKIKVETSGMVTAVDLWNGKVWQKDIKYENGMAEISLDLKYRESILFILDCEKSERFKEDKTKRQYVNLAFELKEHSEETLKKVYEADFVCEDKENDIYISVCAEEMVECFVNGNFAGVSFWNEHEFCLTPFLENGSNDVRLIVTGNLANRYSDKKIFYGLSEKYELQG